MYRIDSFTPEQEAQLPGIRDEWLAYGLSTEPANRPEAEAGVRLAYESAGLKAPTTMVWLDSPMAGAVGAAYFTQLFKDNKPVDGEDWSNLQEQIPSLAKSLGSTAIRDQIYRAVYGQHDVGWLSFYATFQKFGLECCDKLNGIFQVAQNAGWWWLFENTVIITERPKSLTFDPQGRLHNEDGPALLYPDGFAVYAWHGTRVPASLIEDGGWNTTEIFGESNAEIRRCGIEKMGWDKFVDEGGMTLVASCPDPGNPGNTISLYDLPETLADLYEQPARVFLCTNGTVERDGTRRKFGLVVPAHHTDPIEAAADMYQFPVEAYRNLEVRR